ncbi:hypothetical protein GCM10018966_023010 [Streptomyces yanii]
MPSERAVGAGRSNGPKKAESEGGNYASTVHPGSFCSQPGATGVTKAGTPTVCGSGSDGT